MTLPRFKIKLRNCKLELRAPKRNWRRRFLPPKLLNLNRKRRRLLQLRKLHQQRKLLLLKKLKKKLRLELKNNILDFKNYNYEYCN
jgi:hypothetical protein